MSAAAAFLARHDWRDPLRLVVAALLAYAVAQALRLPEFYWAVLTALIVTRPGVGATMQAGSARLLGTLGGAGLAALVAASRVWHPPEILLLLAVLLPLGLLITWRPDWRTAPIAAIIVLSSGPLGASPWHAALLRIGEIALGAAIGIAVSWLLLPSRAVPRAAQQLRRCLGHLAAMLEAAIAGDAGRADTEREAARDALRALTLVGRRAHWERADKATLEQTAKRATRLHNDCAFLVRVIDAARAEGSVEIAGERLAPLATAFAAVARAFAQGAPPRAALQAFGGAVDRLVHEGREKMSGSPAAHEQAVRYLLRTVQDDLIALAESLQGEAGRSTARRDEAG